MEKKVNVKEAANFIKQPFTRYILADVDDYRVYLSRFEGDYVFHRHPQDELYFVIEGEMIVDLPDGSSLTLSEGDLWVAEANQIHRTRSEKGALVLMFKAKNLPSEILSPKKP